MLNCLNTSDENPSYYDEVLQEEAQNTERNNEEPNETLRFWCPTTATATTVISDNVSFSNQNLSQISTGLYFKNLNLAFEKKHPKEGKMAIPTKPLINRVTDFSQNLCLRDWRLSYHELVGIGLRDTTESASITDIEEYTTLHFKDYVVEKLQDALAREKGAQKGILKWARKDRTDASKNKIGWATKTEAHKDFIVKLLEGL